MTKTKKNILYLSVLFLLITITALVKYKSWQEDHVLTVGIYTGSSWDVPNNHQYQAFDYAIKQFKKKHPHVQIKYENGIQKSDYRNWLSEKIVQGKAPDLMIVPDNLFNLLAHNGAFKDLSGFMAEDKISPDRFYSVALNSSNLNDHQYALPFQANPQFMVMNKDLLLRNKLAIPPFNWSPAELKKLCHQLALIKSKDPDLGITSEYKWNNALLAYNYKLSKSKDNPIQLTNNAAIKGFNLIEYLQNVGHTRKVDSQLFDRGKVAFTPISLAKYRTYTSYPYYVTNEKSFTWSCLQMPHIKKAKATQVDISMFAISSKARNPKLAWKFLKTLCINKKVQQKAMEVNKGCSVLPQVVLNKKTQKILNQNNQGSLSTTKLNAIMNNGWNQPKFRNWGEVYSILDHSIINALDTNTLDKQIFYIQQQANSKLKN